MQNLSPQSLALGIALGVASTLAVAAAKQAVGPTVNNDIGPRFQMYFNGEDAYVLDGESGAVWQHSQFSELPNNQTENFYRPKG